MPTMTEAEATQLFRDEPLRHIDVGEGHVAYRRAGEGPDVLFVHGWPVHGATFRTLLPHLTEHVTCHVIDLPGTGSSQFGASTRLTFDQHIISIQRTIEALGLDQLAVVGHNSGGLAARHAVVGDSRLRAMGLINTEMSSGLGWRFKLFLSSRNVPGIGAALGWTAGQTKIRANPFILGDAFADADLLNGEFDEFFLQPLHRSPAHRDAGIKLLKSFDTKLIDQLVDVHRRITVPVRLVWGDQDPFFPVAQARGEVATFPDAELKVIAGAGLFAHEERPAEVAAALLPVLTRS